MYRGVLPLLVEIFPSIGAVEPPPSSRRRRAAARMSGAISRTFTPIRSAGCVAAAQCVTQPHFRQRWNSMDLSPHK